MSSLFRGSGCIVATLRSYRDRIASAFYQEATYPDCHYARAAQRTAPQRSAPQRASLQAEPLARRGPPAHAAPRSAPPSAISGQPSPSAISGQPSPSVISGQPSPFSDGPSPELGGRGPGPVRPLYWLAPCFFFLPCLVFFFPHPFGAARLRNCRHCETLVAASLFLATFRGMPTANAEGWIESEGSIGKGAERPFRCYPPIRSSPRRSPSA